MTGQNAPTGRTVGRLVRRVFGHGVDDAELLRLFAVSRDESAFAELVRRHGPMVLATSRRIVGDPDAAHDAFQATFLVLARKAGSLSSVRCLGGWLHTVACRSALKARNRLPKRRPADVSEFDIPAAADPDDALIRRELTAVIDEEVRRLPEPYREAVVLHYLQGHTYAQAAERLECPVGTFAARLSRAREWLRERLIHRGWDAVGFGAALGGLIGASVSEATVRKLTGAAAAFAAGRLGLVGAEALTLYREVTIVMWMSKVKAAGVALVVLAGLGLATAQDRPIDTGRATPLETEPVPDPFTEEPLPIEARDSAEARQLRQKLAELQKRQLERLSAEELRLWIQHLEVDERESAAERELMELRRRVDELAGDFEKFTQRHPNTRAAQEVNGMARRLRQAAAPNTAVLPDPPTTTGPGGSPLALPADRRDPLLDSGSSPAANPALADPADSLPRRGDR